LDPDVWRLIYLLIVVIIIVIIILVLLKVLGYLLLSAPLGFTEDIHYYTAQLRPLIS